MEVVVTTGAKSCKAPVKSSLPTNQLFTGRMPFLSPNQQCQSIHWSKIILLLLIIIILLFGFTDFSRTWFHNWDTFSDFLPQCCSLCKCIAAFEGCLVGNMSLTQCSSISQQHVCSGTSSAAGFSVLSVLCWRHCILNSICSQHCNNTCFKFLTNSLQDSLSLD